MKTLLQKNESIWPMSHYWGKNQKKQTIKWISVVLVFAVLNLTVGCQNYFKVNTAAQPSSETILGLSDIGKTIVVHFNQKKWLLTDIQVKDETVKGMLNGYQMPPTHKPVKPERPNRYLTRASQNQRYLLNEVHLYLDEFAEMGNNKVSIPVSSISKIEIYDKDTATTVGSYVLGSLGIATGAFAVIVIIVALTKQSCPFIYTWNGENYAFAGEIYSGSIHKPLERHDYLKLPTYPGQQTYTLKISNEVREIQNTNFLELLVLDHPENTDVLVDKYGKITTLSKVVAPTLATNLEGKNVTALIASKDKQFYQSDSHKNELPLKDGVIMEFPSQGDAKTAHVAIHAKNSIMLDYMMEKFNNLFGSSYHPFMNKQRHSTFAKLNQWPLDQNIPLSLYVERDGKWEYDDYYNIAGPMTFKDDVISIPLNGHETNPLKLKLEFGNFFWEIDYAAVEYSTDMQVTSSTIPVKKAVTGEQKDVVGLLSKDDHKYFTQPTMNDQAVVTFNLPELTNQSRTIILHSKGWYEILMDPKGKPDMEYLKAFRQPGRFNQFTNEHLKKMEQLVSQP